MRRDVARVATLLALAAVAILIACGRRPEALAVAPTPAPTQAAPVSAPSPSPAAATAGVPALGELMTLQQMRHAKLWWAGAAGNWPLAAYEIDELQEGFDDIVRYHPTHKDSPVPIKDAVETIMTDPIAKAREAIVQKERKKFAEAYDLLTDGCNACHQAANFGFNVVQRPKVNTFSNQSFAPQDARDR